MLSSLEQLLRLRVKYLFSSGLLLRGLVEETGPAALSARKSKATCMVVALLETPRRLPHLLAQSSNCGLSADLGSEIRQGVVLMLASLPTRGEIMRCYGEWINLKFLR